VTAQAAIVVAYFVASLCVVYKLAYLVRQAAPLAGLAAFAFRILAVLAGTAMLYRMVQVVRGDEVVQWIDVAHQLGWCLILYFIIVMVGRKKNVW